MDKKRNLDYIPGMVARQWERTLDRFRKGEVHDRDTLRKILKSLRGNKCEVDGCNIGSWMGKDITLQVDHVNGDAGNSLPDNVRLICPNCHSQTSTFGARNKGNGRKARGLPLK